MKIIGITGGIGSGKTTVCKLFEALGVPVFYADQVAKDLMHSDAQVKAEIQGAFGTEVYKEGVLDRGYLAQIVFADDKKLDRLNQIVHPAVGRATFEWADSHSDHAYGLKEAAILFESGSHLHVEKVISVWAPLDLRIQRVVKRDGVEEEAVMARVRNQISEDLRLSLSDYVIENAQKQLLVPQVHRIHGILSNLV